MVDRRRPEWKIEHVIQHSDAVGTASAVGTSSNKRRPGRPTLSNEQLLDTALDLFLENGFERTSIEAITAAAGMAKRTVYARYGDKTTLFKAALTRAIEEWIVPVQRLQAAESEDIEDTLVTIGQILVANVLSPGGLRLLRLTNAVSGHMPEIGAFNVQKGPNPPWRIWPICSGAGWAATGPDFQMPTTLPKPFLISSSAARPMPALGASWWTTKAVTGSDPSAEATASDTRPG